MAFVLIPSSNGAA